MTTVTEEGELDRARGLALALCPMLVLVALALIGLMSLQVAEAGGTGNYPPPATGDWVISTPTEAFDEAIELKGHLLVQAGGSLELDDVDLYMNCSYAGQYHIEVKAGGALDANGSLFSARNMSNPYYIVIRDGATAVLTYNTLEGMGWDKALLHEQLGLAVLSDNVTIVGNTIRYSRAGVYVNGVSPTIDGNHIVDNFYGLWLQDVALVSMSGNNISRNNVGIYAEGSIVIMSSCELDENNFKGITAVSSNLIMSQTTVTRTREIAMSGLGANIFMVNGTLEGDKYSLVLDGNSSMESYNGTIDRYFVSFKDSLSHLTVYWYVDIEVVWWSDLGPVANASVEVHDTDHDIIGLGKTGQDGVLRDLLVPGFDANKSKLVFHSPIDVMADISGRTGNSTAELDGPTLVTVLIDDIAPGVNITSPPLGGYFNDSSVEVRGVMWDNETGPSHVEVSVDGGNFSLANGTALWNISFELSEGGHVITVRAWDVAGNARTMDIDLMIDTVAPMVRIGGPEDGLVTTLTHVWFNGTAEPGANLTVDGVAINNTNGTWGLYVELVEGENQLAIEAVDLAGNRNSSSIRVRRDTMVDPLVLEPGNGTSTNVMNLTVQGRTEPGTVIVVRWTTTEMEGNNTTVVKHNMTVVADGVGNFSLVLALREGVNNYTLSARDVMNNTALLDLTYHLDSTPPKLVLTSPGDRLHYTNKNGVNIKGYTEEGARVYLGAQELQLYDLQFSIRVEVFLGMNNFTLWAVDLAGNVIEFNITVIVDKDPPPLNISRPFKSVSRHTGPSITITGHTEGNATVYVNGVRYQVRGDGYFAIKRSLAFGRNKFAITAMDQAGNPTSVNRVVIRERPPTDHTDLYVFISSVVIGMVIALVIVLFYLHRTGRLKGVRRLFRRGKSEDDGPEDMEDEELPTPVADPGVEGLTDDVLPPPDIPPLKDEGAVLEKDEEEGEEEEELEEEMELVDEKEKERLEV